MARKKSGRVSPTQPLTSRLASPTQPLTAVWPFWISCLAVFIAFGVGYLAAHTRGSILSSIGLPEVSSPHNVEFFDASLEEEGGEEEEEEEEDLAPEEGKDVYEEESEATAMVLKKVTPLIEKRLGDLLKGTFTNECRARVIDELQNHIGLFIDEGYMPFERTSIGRFANCDTRAHRSNKFVDASVVRLTYLLLMHEEAYQAIRLIEALQEPQHNFVIHVDGKAASNETYYQMMDYAASYSNVHMITGAQRVNVSWGGFNVVQGTLNGIMYAVQKGIPFHWLVTLSGYTYPLVSNQKIRETLAKYPVDTNFLEMSPRPNRPAPRTWHNFVECDNQMRRIARLATPVDFSLHVGSQWLLISSAFANYLVSRGNFADKYRVYGKHTMVADENYFVTVLRNSEFCHTHENTNFAQVQFDEWEHDKANGPNVNKCLQPNPDHCGRSPTIIDLAFLPVLELSGAMFARKFDPEIDHRSIDAIDIMRSRDSSSNSGSWSLGGGGGGDQGLKTRHFEDVVITTTAGPLTSQSMCLDLSQQANSKARVTSCTRGKLSQHFSLGPCSSDGSLDFSTEAEHQLLAQQGEFSRPYCLVRSKAGNAETQTSGCLDVERESVQPGTKLISFYCRNTKWNQLFTFGPNGSIQINIPLFRYRDRKMCLEAETGEVGAEIVLADCDVTEPRQRFYFHDS